MFVLEIIGQLFEFGRFTVSTIVTSWVKRRRDNQRGLGSESSLNVS